MKIFLHTRKHGHTEWENHDIELGQVPAVGEYVSVRTDDPDDADWHRVQLVVHVAHKAEFQAEVYCVRVNHVEAVIASKVDVTRQ